MVVENTNEQITAQEENKELFGQLTKRNEQYMMSLDKALIAGNISEEKRVIIYNEMLKNLINGQKSGQTARQIYGTVTERTNDLLASPKDNDTGRSEDWKIMLDGGLLMGAMFALITGISAFIGSGQGSEMGIITMILNFIIGGFVILLISKNLPNKNKGKKGNTLRYILVSTSGMLGWMFIMTASMALLPSSINILMSAGVNIAIGVTAFAAKMYFKRKLNIRGGLF
ncbi:Uncharacterized membrane-anchored protein [Carnobacterium iners]|uniref:Uncharacterized membrane-anchored protein n=1 Tax=Carnobacterium iners TaxID=1073423 RepID=A0A1X7MRP0_9LACT|nr:DUF1129 family protein [Carnobacterium iners]SEK73148.1 Uncharacterized membrane-anchored protein [Carnobacterium iners]SMH27490.1 Uncharacterized membrane-anchored protein [Carnobacterium iners]